MSIPITEVSNHSWGLFQFVEGPWCVLSVHPDVRALIEAHVRVTDEPLGLLAQRLFRVGSQLCHNLLSKDFLHLGSRRQFGNVVAILFPCEIALAAKNSGWAWEN